jgi:sigma-B regulation protein RsbU (phosphoserine phosphatase)
MLNLLKSILTHTADKPKTKFLSRHRSLPNRDRQGAVPREWAIAGDNSHAVESDFYDVSSPDGRAANFLIGEVSASGVRATALVNLIQSMVRSADPAAAALEINRMLYVQDRYAAMFWSQFDPETRLLHFINAGHLPPLLFKANRRPMLRLDHAGPGLGVFPNATYQQGTASLDPGDILVIYSDGIVEASDHSDESFGEDRLITVVELSRNKSVEEIRNRILSSVQAFAGETAPATGRTLLVIRYAPSSYNTVTRLSPHYRDNDSARPSHLCNF